MNNKLPSADINSLVIQELSDEVLIYNLETKKAVCLNSSAAFVWKYCDGKTEFRQLISEFEKQNKVVIDEDFINLVLDELSKAELIKSHSIKFDSRVSRRKALLNYALPMAMLPIITSIITPTAAKAQSVVCTDPAATGPCIINTDCPPYIGCQAGCNCGVICINNCCFNEVSCS